jgi:hypothetical protein
VKERRAGDVSDPAPEVKATRRLISLEGGPTKKG